MISTKLEANSTSSSNSLPSLSPLRGATRRNPWFLYVLTCCSTIGGFLFGYDTGVISGALVLIKSPKVFNLNHFQSESVVSAAIFGAIWGALFASAGSHNLGRKPIIVLSSLMFALGSFLMGIAETYSALLAGRIIVGIGIGTSSMIVPMYIAEISPPDVRGRLVSLNTLLVTGGQFFACLLDALLSQVPNGWRYMLGFAAFPAIIQFFGFLVLPESPRYLISAGKKEQAWSVLVRVRGSEDIETEFSHIENEVKRIEKEDHDVWQDITSPGVMRALVLGCVLQALQQFCGINTVMYYGATIIQMAGFKDESTAIWLSAIVSFSNFIFTFVGIFLVDRIGRRPLTLGSLAGSIVSLVALGGTFFVAAVKTPSVVGSGACAGATTCFDCVALNGCGFCGQTMLHQGHTFHNLCLEGNATASTFGQCSKDAWSFSSCPDMDRTPSILIVVALFLYLAFFASGMGPMPWTINSEIYPLHVRSFALSLATSVNWISNLVVSFTFLSIIDVLHPSGAFWLYAAISCVGFAFLWCVLPETKGLELEEIQSVFNRQRQYKQIEKQS